jgi:hypothetical protein
MDLRALPTRGGQSCLQGWSPKKVMSDNASEFHSAEFEAAEARLGHLFIRAGRPQRHAWGTCSSGRAGRRPTASWNGSRRRISDEHLKPAFARYLIPEYTGLRLDLDRNLTYYKTDRAHTRRWTKGRTPEKVIGKRKMWSHRANPRFLSGAALMSVDRPTTVCQKSLSPVPLLSSRAS